MISENSLIFFVIPKEILLMLRGNVLNYIPVKIRTVEFKQKKDKKKKIHQFGIMQENIYIYDIVTIMDTNCY